MSTATKKAYSIEQKLAPNPFGISNLEGVGAKVFIFSVLYPPGYRQRS